MFILDADGVGLLLVGPWGNIVWTFITAMIGVAALAGGASGWFLEKANAWERTLLVVAELLLVYPLPLYDFIGIGLMAFVGRWQKFGKLFGRNLE